MLHYLYLYLLTIPVFFVIDMLWLNVVAHSFYQSRLAHLLGPVHWPAAITFYLIYILGILLFAVLPALQNESITKALVWGALFGFFTYATYDLTNYATLKDWPLSIVLIDIVWGVVLGSTVATISYWLGKTFIF